MADLVLIRACGKDDGNNCVPHGLLSIAMYLRKNNFDIEIMDRMLDTRPVGEFVDDVARHRPSIIGISAMTCQFPDAIKLTRILREKTGAKIVVGGTHVTVVPEEGLKIADGAVIGEGEKAMLDVLSRGKGSVSGIVKKEPLDDLDEIPIPDTKLLKKLFARTDWASLMTARGCPYECIFCLNKKQRCRKIRYHSIPYIIDYIELIVKAFGTKNFFIMDDIFTLDKKRVFDFCDEIIKRNLRLELRCFTHPNHGDLEMYKHMRRAGFSWVEIGAESGNDRILELIKKKTTVSRIRQTVRSMQKAHLIPGVLFMVGNIGETEDTIMDTVKFARSLRTPVHFAYAQPLPGTEFLDMAPRHGTLLGHDYAMLTNKELTFVPNGLTADRLRELYEFARRVTRYPKFRYLLVEKLPFLKKPFRKIKELIKW